MTILAWNYCGLGEPQAIQVLLKLLKLENPSMVFLIKTKLKKLEFELLKYRLSYENSLVLNCVGKGSSHYHKESAT